MKFLLNTAAAFGCALATLTATAQVAPTTVPTVSGSRPRPEEPATAPTTTGTAPTPQSPALNRADGTYRDGSYQTGQQTPQTGTLNTGGATGQGYQGQYGSGQNASGQNMSGTTTIQTGTERSGLGTPSQQSMKGNGNPPSGNREPKSPKSKRTGDPARK